ncbi:MAG TPA: transcriptional regulator [Methanobacterium sp.]|nr:transcriptional regulator [Methanobacterium sp.]
MNAIPMNRDQVLIEITELLANNGFETSNIYDRSCFDMVARRELIILLLKVLINVDGFNSQQAVEIKKLARTFLASPLVVGFKSKTEPLEEDVVYERHGIPVVAPETLKNMVADEVYPEILADRGGYYVNIHGEVLREVRERQNLSLKDLADLAHVSRETIYKYEHGMVRAYPETAMILESILNMKITLSIDLFKAPEGESDILKTTEANSETEDKNPHEMHNIEPIELINLGFGVLPTNRTPFDAISQAKNKKEKENILLTNLEKNRNKQALKKMAINVKDLSDITQKEAVFIMENKQIVECIEGIPCVNTQEICEMKNCREFIRLLKERKN